MEKIMLKKKSYMNNNNILNEGFFDKLSQFLKSRPKVSGKKKLGLLKSLKLALSVSGLNRSIDKFEKVSREIQGDDYKDVDIPRFTPQDFIK